jgi:CheY-like chemotaxis protein
MQSRALRGRRPERIEESRFPVDCVILDYQMPEMDGAQVLRSMRHSKAPPQVILVSGSEPPRELRLIDAIDTTRL